MGNGCVGWGRGVWDGEGVCEMERGCVGRRRGV